MAAFISFDRLCSLFHEETYFDPRMKKLFVFYLGVKNSSLLKSSY
jgi:hypothetical protein